MKKMLLIIAVILFAAQITEAQTNSVLMADFKNSKKIPKRSIFGEFSFGDSNYGLLAQATINYKSKNKFISAAWYKSHICVLNDDKGLYFPDTKSTDKHTTITTLSLCGGIIFPGKLRPSLSCGISLEQFLYEQTTPEANVISLPSVWATATGSHYREEILSSHTVTTIGVPLEFKVHFAQRHFIGLDAGVKVDLNSERVLIAGLLGIRLGKLFK